MKKMNVSFLMKKDWFNKCFSPAEIKRLKSFAGLCDDGYEDINENKMTEAVKDATAVLTCWDTPPITAKVLAAGKDIKIICHCAGSVKGYISADAWDEIWKRDIAVTNTSAALGRGVAEFTLGMIITGLKRVSLLQQGCRSGKWPELRHLPREPYDITVGVIGGGYCGGHLIKLLQNFEISVLLYDPFKTDDECRQMGAKKVELEYLLANSDVVTLHAPNIPQTVNLINSERIKLIKDGALFVNTSRGSEVDEQALIEELKTGRFFACLDVTNPEPAAPDNPLRNMENVVLTPHIAGHTSNGFKRQGKYAVDELERFSNGREMLFRIKRERLNIIA